MQCNVISNVCTIVYILKSKVSTPFYTVHHFCPCNISNPLSCCPQRPNWTPSQVAARFRWDHTPKIGQFPMFRPQKTAASARFLDSKFLITGVTKPCAEEFLLNPPKKRCRKRFVWPTQIDLLNFSIGLDSICSIFLSVALLNAFEWIGLKNNTPSSPVSYFGNLLNQGQPWEIALLIDSLLIDDWFIHLIRYLLIKI